MKNKVKLKRSAYSVIITAVFIVAVILITILSTALADRYPLDIDLTAEGVHTMSADNVDYIKSVDKKVNIYVLLPEDLYKGTGSGYNMHYYAANFYFVDYQPNSHTNYYTQTAEMLKKYTMYNDNITVTYIDATQPSAKEITEPFNDFTWSIGDILVESTFTVNGKEVTRRTALPFSEVYSLDSYNPQVKEYYNYYLSGQAENYALYGYNYGYYITENNIEDTLSSAIYKVTSENTPLYLVPTMYSNAETIKKQLEPTLISNNFSLEYTDGLISDLLAGDNKNKYTGIILSDCKADITNDDRTAIDALLSNDGKNGKSLFYFAGTNTYKLNNITALLADWGIGFDAGVVYETDSRAHLSGDPTSISLLSMETEYTEKSDTISNRTHIAKNIVPMTQLYPTSITATYARKTTAILRTASSAATVMPIDADVKTWKPTENIKLDAFPVAIYSRDEKVLEDNSYAYSAVMAFASVDYIVNDLAAQTAYIANIPLTLDTFNEASGVAETPFNFVAKTIKSENFKAFVTEGKTNAIKIIFMACVPVALIGVGTFVWIRRKRK